MRNQKPCWEGRDNFSAPCLIVAVAVREIIEKGLECLEVTNEQKGARFARVLELALEKACCLNRGPIGAGTQPTSVEQQTPPPLFHFNQFFTPERMLSLR